LSHGGHLEFPISKWFTSLVQDHPMIIPAKSQYNWLGGFTTVDSCHIFSSPGHRACELLSLVSIRRPSISFSHLTLLLWNSSDSRHTYGYKLCSSSCRLVPLF
jgi:hypothetical protein